MAVNADSVPEISLQYTVSEAGAIVFPTLLSPLKAQGLTVGQLRDLLIEHLTEYMHEPKVTVDIAEHHSHKVLVLGPFQLPGKYELRRESVPLLDIILEAGGLRELRENDELMIIRNPTARDLLSSHSPTRDHGSPITVDLQGLLRDGDATQNVMIQAGDIIYLTSFFAGEQYVYVAGGGRRGAGAIAYEPGLTAFKALLRAGVVPDDPMVELLIIRGQTSREQVISTRLIDPAHPSVADVTLMPEDIVILSEASSQVVYVAGEVNKPGALPYREGLTVLQAVLDAGGMSKGAVGSKVRVLREDASGGRKEITVDMDAALEMKENVDLMLGDIVVVPGMSLQADVMVTGKVNTPGMVAYEDFSRHFSYRASVLNPANTAEQRPFIPAQVKGIRQAFAENPVLGIGFGGFRYSRYDSTHHEIHSEPGRMLAETGIIGLMFYLFFLCMLLEFAYENAFRLKDLKWSQFSTVIFAALFGIYTSALYNRHLRERSFWVLVGIIVCINRLVKQRSEETSVRQDNDESVCPISQISEQEI